MTMIRVGSDECLYVLELLHDLGVIKITECTGYGTEHPYWVLEIEYETRRI